MNKHISKPLIAAALHSESSGKEIGPYFLGISLEAIESKYAKKLVNKNLELREIGIERLLSKSGFRNAFEDVKSGKYSACMFL